MHVASHTVGRTTAAVVMYGTGISKYRKLYFFSMTAGDVSKQQLFYDALNKWHATCHSWYEVKTILITKFKKSKK